MVHPIKATANSRHEVGYSSKTDLAWILRYRLVTALNCFLRKALGMTSSPDQAAHRSYNFCSCQGAYVRRAPAALRS
jgi:hypothetical protein